MSILWLYKIHVAPPENPWNDDSQAEQRNYGFLRFQSGSRFCPSTVGMTKRWQWLPRKEDKALFGHWLKFRESQTELPRVAFRIPVGIGLDSGQAKRNFAPFLWLFPSPEAHGPGRGVPAALVQGQGALRASDKKRPIYIYMYIIKENTKGMGRMGNFRMCKTNAQRETSRDRQ